VGRHASSGTSSRGGRRVGFGEAGGGGGRTGVGRAAMASTLAISACENTREKLVTFKAYLLRSLIKLSPPPQEKHPKKRHQSVDLEVSIDLVIRVLT